MTNEETQLIIKKATFKAWTIELFEINKIDEKRYFAMLKMIENLKK